PPPTVRGGDDVALRQRQPSGTVRIELERRHPGALLPERTAATLAQWLPAHPGGQVRARERSPTEAEGARHGAPAAPQVADRLPLLQHRREALEQVCSTHSQTRAAVQAHRQTLHTQGWTLPLQGWTAPAMAPQGGVSLRTGQRDRRSA